MKKTNLILTIVALVICVILIPALTILLALFIPGLSPAFPMVFVYSAYGVVMVFVLSVRRRLDAGSGKEKPPAFFTPAQISLLISFAAFLVGTYLGKERETVFLVIGFLAFFAAPMLAFFRAVRNIPARIAVLSAYIGLISRFGAGTGIGDGLGIGCLCVFVGVIGFVTVRALLRDRPKVRTTPEVKKTPGGKKTPGSKRKKGGEAAIPSVKTPAPAPTVQCTRCGKEGRKDGFETIDKQYYCPVCAGILRKDIEAARERNRQGRVCCVCGAADKGERILVDDRYYCRDCFNKKYPPEEDA